MSGEGRFRDRLSLLGVRFEGRHGVLPREKEVPQPFEVDVVLHADLSSAAGRDDIAATVDYADLQQLVERHVGGGHSHDLIESLAGAIASEVLATTDPGIVDAVEVRVRKPRAPLPGPFETVEATLVRRRDDTGG